MSASKLRKAAAEDDFESFSKGMSKGLGKDGTEKLFMTLRQAMQVEEFGDDFAEASYYLYEIAPKLDPKGLREAYFNQNLFKVGDLVENSNTGIVSKVVSRGSNYVISIDERDGIYRSWLKDLVEVNDLKYFNWKPAGEVGTDQLNNYVRKLTPGEFIRKLNKRDKTSS
tara:strand:- start:515 stop:1021 length:507 start_codon:yes stop_codon:yes gene_type:complete